MCDTRTGSGQTFPTLLQWHVTERCNLRCAHCYQECYGGDELPLGGLVDVLREYVTWLSAHRAATRSHTRGQITLTGGEPFVRSDFLEFLRTVARHAPLLQHAILTNGTLVDRALARELARLRPRFVQVSIDGTESTHDATRGQGAFARAVAGIRDLVAARVPTVISFTAHRGNYRELPAVVALGRRLGVRRVWADRCVPRGQGAGWESTLTAEQTQEFIALLAAQRRAARRGWFARTEVAAHRALQFLNAGGRPYACTAGRTLLTIQANGDLVPCRRMPIVVGNVRQMRLEQLYRGSEVLRALRVPERVAHGCAGCMYARVCRGGLRCLAHAMYGTPFHADPGCWRAQATRSGESAECLDFFPA